MVSILPDADMQAAPKALFRPLSGLAMLPAKPTRTLVLVRDGVLVEEFMGDARLADKAKDSGQVRTMRWRQNSSTTAAPRESKVQTPTF